jgi:hypothetical protein
MTDYRASLKQDSAAQILKKHIIKKNIHSRFHCAQPPLQTMALSGVQSAAMRTIEVKESSNDKLQ